MAPPELAALYARAEAAVAAAGPRCALSGRCCDFPASGHELWCTELEVAHALAAAGGTVPAAEPGRCPWWIGGLCSLRDGRPLGCRLSFCDPAWTDEGAALYERLHAELKAMHAAQGRPYAYRPFVEAVREAARRPGSDP